MRAATDPFHSGCRATVRAPIARPGNGSGRPCRGAARIAPRPNTWRRCRHRSGWGGRPRRTERPGLAYSCRRTSRQATSAELVAPAIAGIQERHGQRFPSRIPAFAGNDRAGIPCCVAPQTQKRPATCRHSKDAASSQHLARMIGQARAFAACQRHVAAVRPALEAIDHVGQAA